MESVLSEQENLASLEKEIKEAKIIQLCGIAAIVVGVLLSACLLQLAPCLERTLPISDETRRVALAFVCSVFCAWFGLVVFAYYFYRHRKLLKELRTRTTGRENTEAGRGMRKATVRHASLATCRTWSKPRNKPHAKSI